ncbi:MULTISPECIES: hypothetical protein [unclassified Arthrobacter]|uniref:hypothetical protein n=1 Tax=unclassified Arthrobacter TaxID=235627 RepID=UPI002097DD72|nr:MULTISPECIES: hypothetical protein [unclassified Arthrobacter]MDD1478604.1 hypothetical protein [Arthrobacter sp. H16F315]MDN4643971.1 hypothetical protein [Arthrobacter sp. PsM3]
MNKKHMTVSSAAIAAAIALAGCSAGSGGSMPGMNMGGSGMASGSATAASSPAGTAPAGAAPDQVRAPNDQNAPLTVGIAAALLALAGGISYLAQRRARNSGV